MSASIMCVYMCTRFSPYEIFFSFYCCCCRTAFACWWALLIGIAEANKHVKEWARAMYTLDSDAFTCICRIYVLMCRYRKRALVFLHCLFYIIHFEYAVGRCTPYTVYTRQSHAHKTTQTHTLTYFIQIQHAHTQSVAHSLTHIHRLPPFIVRTSRIFRV